MRHLLAAALLLATADAQVVPAPQRAKFGSADAHRGQLISCEAAFRPQAEAFATALGGLGAAGAAVADRPGTPPTVVFALDKALPPSAYRIRSTGRALAVSASSGVGAAHAAASLLQTTSVEAGIASWPQMRIDDAPDHPYRSFLVDMGRNPHAPETLRQVVDMMWFYKANYLQLHLTDDQIFSWPSKAYPDLYSERAGWSWDDFVALEAYSQARGVTIVPELEVPGHSGILRRKYPDVFGKTPTDLATKPEALEGIETLILEMISVFRATPYVHVGGDEAYGVPQDIQRDLINRLNVFVKSRGKRTLVWEGPRLGKGDNKVAEDVIHVNWRTIDFPAQQMLDAGYEIIAAPWDPLYIVDHYPQTMFTAVDLQRCYRWEIRRFAHINQEMATFSKPHRTKRAKGILGFCMPWWEGRQENLFPLCLPRLAAVTSAAWNRSGEDDFDDYYDRYENSLPVLESISGIELPAIPYADPASQRDNFAYRAEVTPSDGATQPHFGPARLTNGIPDRFDHFLGFPTKPEPLEIVIKLRTPAEIGRVVVYERAVGDSHEVYRLYTSTNGVVYENVGEAKKGTRGGKDHVEHTFKRRRVSHLKIVTDGCYGLVFPSFSRLSEVMAFAE